MSTTLSDTASIRHQIDTLLGDYFAKHAQASAAIHPHYGLLWSSMQRLFHAGGKRLRPTMLVLGYEAFGGKDTSRILPIAAAHELLHLSMLIHDDIIDRDDIRYGIPNVVGQYSELYRSYVTDAAERAHYARSAALLGGDLLISAAHQLILESSVDDRLKLQTYRQMGTAIFEVAGGELLDTEAVFRGNDAADIATINRHKTIGYSFIAPLVSGAQLADAPEDALEIIKSFAIALGMAFQYTDDLLGVFGDEAVTGKSNLGDIREGKRTRLMVEAYALMSDEQRTIADSVVGNPNASPGDIQHVKQILIDCGARQSVIDEIDREAEVAAELLESLPISTEAHARLQELIIKVTKRNA